MGGKLVIVLIASHILISHGACREEHDTASANITTTPNRRGHREARANASILNIQSLNYGSSKMHDCNVFLR